MTRAKPVSVRRKKIWPRARPKAAEPKRLMVECQECNGNGEHEETCEHCGEWLTEENFDWPEHGMFCKACVKKLDAEDEEARA